MPERLAVELCGIQLQSPVLAASGTFAYGVEFETIVDLNSIGGFVVKGLSREPMPGNAAPRLWETAGGMMNSVGLQNIGVRAFVRDKLPRLRRYRSAIFTNVFGYEPEDYLEVVRVLEDAEGIAAYELNVSCPNTKHGGIFFSSDPVLLGDLVSQIRRVARRPLIVKLSPNVASIATVARAAQEAGADAVSLVNTFVALAIDPRTRKSRIANGLAGLSGPAIKPLAVRMVWEAFQAVRIPIVGLGGISKGEDVAEFLIAGATAVQVGTANFWDPTSLVRITREFDQFLQDQNIQRASDLTGTLEL